MREYGSEFVVNEIQNDFLQSLDPFKTVRFLRSGREALGLAAECISSEGGIIMLPAYCCESMIMPFALRNWKVVYYSLNDDFSVNEKDFFILFKRYSPRAVLLMNYFGSASIESIALKIKSLSDKIILIEDITHVLFSKGTFLNKVIDFYVGSIRKWLGIYDGAIFVSKDKNETAIIDSEAEFVKMRKQGQTLKLEYQYSKNENLKNEYLGILKTAEQYLDRATGINVMSHLSYEIIKHLNVESLGLARRENYYHLYSLIKDLDGIIFPVKNTNYSVSPPFSLPILVNHRDTVQKQFALRGLYAQVLWPINEKCRETCKIASKMSDKLLSIPIDQRFDYDDIEDIAVIVKSVITEYND